MKRRGLPAEIYDEPSVVDKKVKQLAKLIQESKRTVVYTGAGISTSADIPDYRGPNGVWTLAAQGKTVKRVVNMKRCNPTYTHMCLKEMYKFGLVSHILSQNCDGLHLRSGLPHKALSEVHGNMFIEVCDKCDPEVMYTRPFDCTAGSAYQKHETERKCSSCDSALRDTIVHFGEVGKLDWPLNWTGVYDALEDCDLILCLGSSLNVLKCYTQIWPSYYSQTKVVIVNLQKTPKDNIADIKIHSETDLVMRKLTELLNITPGPYCRTCDPVLNLNGTESTTSLMDNVTDCSCGNPTTAISEEEEQLENPGWWAAEINRIGPAIGGNVVVAEVEENGPPPRTRAQKKRGGRPRREIETPFEKDIRETVVHLLKMTCEQADDFKKKKGRRKLLPVEKPGFFRLNSTETKPTEGKLQMAVPDHDWEECVDEDDSGSDVDDPSFDIPKRMLEKTFWRGPAPARKSKKVPEDDIPPPPPKRPMPEIVPMSASTSDLLVVDDASQSSSTAISSFPSTPGTPANSSQTSTSVESSEGSPSCSVMEGNPLDPPIKFEEEVDDLQMVQEDIKQEMDTIKTEMEEDDNDIKNVNSCHYDNGVSAKDVYDSANEVNSATQNGTIEHPLSINESVKKEDSDGCAGYKNGFTVEYQNVDPCVTTKAVVEEDLIEANKLPLTEN